MSVAEINRPSSDALRDPLDERHARLLLPDLGSGSESPNGEILLHRRTRFCDRVERDDLPASELQQVSEVTTADFVHAVDPAYILSSNDRTLTGKQKHFEHLIGDAQLLRTNRCGAITVHISKDGAIKVETFIQAPEQ